MPVVVVDVTLQPSVQLLDIPEVREIEIPGFQGGEEDFHGRIVEVMRPAQPGGLRESLERPRDMLAVEREVGLDCDALAAVIIDDGEGF